MPIADWLPYPGYPPQLYINIGFGLRVGMGLGLGLGSKLPFSGSSSNFIKENICDHFTVFKFDFFFVISKNSEKTALFYKNGIENNIKLVNGAYIKGKMAFQL